MYQKSFSYFEVTIVYHSLNQQSIRRTFTYREYIHKGPILLKGRKSLQNSQRHYALLERESDMEQIFRPADHAFECSACW